MLSEEIEVFQNDKSYGSSRADWNEELSEVRTTAPGVMSDLAATKYYTPVPQPVLTYICIHDQLSDGAKVLWFHLYRSAAQWENWTIRRGVTSLAQELGVGERTIQRRLDELERNSLIVRMSRFADHRQLVNELRVTLPYEVATLIQQRIPDRRAPAAKHQHRTRSPSATVHPSRPSSATQPPRQSDHKSPCGIGGQPSGANVEKSGQCDNIVTPPRVKTDTPNNNSYYSVGEQPQLDTPSVKDNRQTPTKPLQSFLAALWAKPVQQGPDTPADNLKATLLCRLTKMGYHGRQREQLVKEVLYSVRNHDWQGPLAKAVNACLKLIKQNRWRTPRGMPVVA